MMKKDVFGRPFVLNSIAHHQYAQKNFYFLCIVKKLKISSKIVKKCLKNIVTCDIMKIVGENLFFILKNNSMEEIMDNKLVYGIHDKPKFGSLLIFAIQQLLAIMAATIAVPAIVGNGMTASAALFGAGVGTLVYQLFTKFRSPVFLGSSFAFIGSMVAAFAGAVTVPLGYLGIICGAGFAGLVYVVIAIIVKCVGVNWINKLMPAAVIGPTVAIIGLSLAGAAIKDVFSYGTVTDPLL